MTLNLSSSVNSLNNKLCWINLTEWLEFVSSNNKDLIILHALIALKVNVKLMKYKGIFIAPTYFILAAYIPT